MKNYFLRRFVYSLFTIFMIATVVFFMMRAIPGGPFTRERPVPDEIMRALNAKYNLDAPLMVQYVDYMKGLITFDLGPSFSKVGVSVNELIATGIGQGAVEVEYNAAGHGRASVCRQCAADSVTRRNKDLTALALRDGAAWVIERR